MSTAGIVDLDMDQGADFAAQIYWINGETVPYTVLAPIRMEIRNSTGQVIYTLQTDDQAPEDETKSVLYNSDSGLIQLSIPADETDKFGRGDYAYDLFVTYQDSKVMNTTRLARLIAGTVHVNGRVTRNV